MPPMPNAKKQKLSPIVALRTMRHHYAADVAKHAKAIYAAAKSLQAIEIAMARAAVDVAGEEYEEHHTITFDGHGSIGNQLENLGIVEYGAGIDDIVTKAAEMEAEATNVAKCADPPPLPYEN
jgi:hypothetical protein